MFNKRQEKRRLSFFLLDFKSYASHKPMEQVKNKKIKPLYQITYRTLSKHNSTPEKYNSYVISLLLTPKTIYHLKYEEMLLEVDLNEFLHKYYDSDSIYKKLVTSIVIITNILKIYPLYLNFPNYIYQVMSHNMIEKQKIIDYFFNHEDSVNKNYYKTNDVDDDKIDFQNLLETSSYLVDEEGLIDFDCNKQIDQDPVNDIEDLITEIEKIEKGVEDKDGLFENTIKYEIDANRRLSKINKRKGQLIERMKKMLTLEKGNEQLFLEFINNKSSHSSKKVFKKITKEQLIQHLKRKKVAGQKVFCSQTPIIHGREYAHKGVPSRHSISYHKKPLRNSLNISSSLSPRKSNLYNFAQFTTPKFSKTSKFLVNLRKQREISSIIKNKNLFLNCIRSPVSPRKLYTNYKDKSKHVKSLSGCFTNSNTKHLDSLSPSISSYYNKSRTKLIGLIDSKSFASKTTLKKQNENNSNNHNRIQTQVYLSNYYKFNNPINNNNFFRNRVNKKKICQTEQKTKKKHEITNFLCTNLKYKLKCM